MNGVQTHNFNGDHHDIAEILLKVVLNTITLTLTTSDSTGNTQFMMGKICGKT
jgi:hypothetical protein